MKSFDTFVSITVYLLQGINIHRKMINIKHFKLAHLILNNISDKTCKQE